MLSNRFFLSVILLVGPSFTAQAQICNQTSRPVFLAVGLESSDQIASLGWIELSQNSCDHSLSSRATLEGVDWSEVQSIWFHARDQIEEPRQTWGRGLSLCVDDLFDNFFADFADSTCEKRGYVHGDFDEFPLRSLSQDRAVILTSEGFR